MLLGGVGPTLPSAESVGAAVLWLVSANVALVRLERADSKGCAGRLDLVVLRLLGRSPKR